MDTLRIGQSFVKTTTAREVIVAHVMSFAHSPGPSVTAEGVESVQQQLRLSGMGRDPGQGYALGRPGPSPPPPERATTRHGPLSRGWLAGSPF